MTLREQIKRDLKAALKARRRDTIITLRTLIAAIDNAEAVATDTDHVPLTGRTADVPRKELSEADVRAILQAEADDYRAAIAEYAQVQHHEEVERLQTALDLVLHYLAPPDVG